MKPEISISVTSSDRLQPVIYATPNFQGVVFGTNEHGFASFECFHPCSLEESFRIYDRPGLPHVAVTAWGGPVWEGRLEDVAIVNGGVRLKAFGYQRALSDVRYTAMLSKTTYDGFRPLTADDIAGRAPERYTIDNNGRIFIGTNKGASYGNLSHQAQVAYFAPYSPAASIQAVSFDYDVNLPSNWRAYCILYNESFTSSAVQWNHTAAGSLQSGSQALTFSGSPRTILTFAVENLTGGSSSPTGEDGDNYLSITNFRTKGTTSTTLSPREIARAMVTYTSGINSTQLSSDWTLINDPGLDLYNETYEEMTPADILTRLAKLGDTSGNVWEWGVYENQLLHFRQRGSAGRAWYVDAASLEVERTIDTLANEVYAVYRQENGRTLRTAASTSTASETRYGLTRQRAVSADTTSATQAGYVRDVALTDGADPSPRIGLVFRELYDSAGGRWPLWYARSGDTITIRNLPPTVSAAIDRIRTFRISETTYSADDDALSVTPETPLPALDVFVARQAAGV